MDIMSIIGLVVVVGLVFFGMIGGGTEGMSFDKLGNFFDPASIAIVVGGTFGALMVTFPLKIVMAMPKMVAKIFIPQKFVPQKYIATIVELAFEARKSSILALEEKVSDYKDEFIKKGVMLAVDATDPENIRDILETELGYMMDRHKTSISFFERGAALAPGFGMIGTLVGLINMLSGMSGDSSNLMSDMAVALITTFYGSILANVLFLPFSNKLRQRSDEEVLCKQIIIEGIIAMVNGDNPKQIQEKLFSFVPPKMRKINEKNEGEK